MSKALADIIMLKTSDPAFPKMASYIINNSPGLANNAILHAYLRTEIGYNVDYIFLAMKINKRKKSTKPKVVVYGFGIVIVKSEEFYISVVSTKGVGSKIVERILDQALLEGIKKIHTDVVLSLVSYYRAFGFINPASKPQKSQDRLCKIEQHRLPDFLTYLITYGKVRERLCLDIEHTDEQTYTMIWKNTQNL